MSETSSSANEDFCTGFAPSIDKDCHTLILGSMPSVASLGQNQYYAHPQNRFWPLMTALLRGKTAQVPTDYQERLSMLLENHIALWDSIAACERHGSLDSAIKHERGNDFTALLARYPAIHTICFNGGKSFACFRKYNRALLDSQAVAFHQMPSTSPANARWRLDDLEACWGKVIIPAHPL